MNKLDYLFTLVQQETKKFKSDRLQGNGREFWQPLKQIFTGSSISASCWKNLDRDLVDKLIKLEEQDNLDNIIEINHFLRQLVRIPTEESPSLRRIMQLALNSGQYLALCDRSTVISNFNFSSSGLDCLQTYLFEKDIQNISLQISDRAIEEVKAYLSTAK